MQVVDRVRTRLGVSGPVSIFPESLPFHARRVSLPVGGWLAVMLILSQAAVGQELSATWQDRYLTIRGSFPGEEIKVHYLEAYCRPGSTDRDWSETVIPHTSELLGTDAEGRELRIRDQLQDGVVVEHRIRVEDDALSFELTAHNPTATASAVAWAQPCVRVDRFTGTDPRDSRELFPPYIRQCFACIDGELQFLPTRPWAREARYTPGQVYCPAHVDRDDVNPRPLSSLVPSHGLCGCVSQDGKWVLGMTWEPYQEIFQGVITCIHNDFRLGGLEPGESKTIRGKLYVLQASPRTLVERYRADFPQQAEGLRLPD